MKLSQIKKNPNNPRVIRDEKFEKLKNSIKSFPQMMSLRPIIVDESGTILGGNMRYEAIKALKMAEIPDEWVKRAEDLTEEEKKEFIVKDNVGFGEWDWDSIANEWDDLPLSDWGLDVPGFEMVEDETTDNDAEPQIDRAEELNKVWKVESGDLWQIGDHRLLCGDSTKRSHVDYLMDGQKAQMVFTDPPYGMDLDTDFSKMDGKGNTYNPVIGDDSDFDFSPFASFDCEEQFWWGADYYRQTLPSGGSWFVWDKFPTDENNNRFGSGFELCWSKVKHKRDIIRIKAINVNWETVKEKQPHPTQKPVELAKYFINTYSADGLTVDFFAGSGTTLVAAQNLKRKCYAIEISENYCAVILERMKTAFPSLEIKRIEQSKTV
jgi:DNA modification methylase